MCAWKQRNISMHEFLYLSVELYQSVLGKEEARELH